ncbi:MAG: cytochrome oxidase putative small subunit CydP [Gammaproteobacteria bacterium]
MLRQWMHDFFFTTRIPLVWELWLLVILKLIGLYILWFLFFSAPIGPSLTEATVAAHLVEP